MVNILAIAVGGLTFLIGVMSLIGLFHRKYHIYRNEDDYTTAFRANAGYCVYAFPYVAGPMRGQWSALYISLIGVVCIGVAVFALPGFKEIWIDEDKTWGQYATFISMGSIPAALWCALKRRDSVLTWAKEMGYSRLTNVAIWAWTSDRAVEKWRKQQGMSPEPEGLLPDPPEPESTKPERTS